MIPQSHTYLDVCSIANPPYNECTKSNLKIYQIYIYNKNIQFNAIFSMLFYCFT